MVGGCPGTNGAAQGTHIGTKAVVSDQALQLALLDLAYIAAPARAPTALVKCALRPTFNRGARAGLCRKPAVGYQCSLLHVLQRSSTASHIPSPCHSSTSYPTDNIKHLLAYAQVQRCTLLSIKTGGCPENCNYCSQSSHWSEDTGLKAEKLMDLEPVYEVGLNLFCCFWVDSPKCSQLWAPRSRGVMLVLYF